MLGVTVLGLGSNLPLTLTLTCGGAHCACAPTGAASLSVTELAVAFFQRAGPGALSVAEGASRGVPGIFGGRGQRLT